MRILSWFRAIPTTVKRLLPGLALIAVAIALNVTDLFSQTFTEFVKGTLESYFRSLLPYTNNLLIVVAIIYVAWLIYPYLRRGFERALGGLGASARTQEVSLQALKLFTWGVVAWLIAFVFAADLFGRLVLGFSVLGAAVMFALQGAANDLVSGLQMQASKRISRGQNVEILGMNITGKVIEIGYSYTTIEAADGMISVPNRKIGEQPIKWKKPEVPKQLIIAPDHFRQRK